MTQRRWTRSDMMTQRRWTTSDMVADVDTHTTLSSSDEREHVNLMHTRWRCVDYLYCDLSDSVTVRSAMSSQSRFFGFIFPPLCRRPCQWHITTCIVHITNQYKILNSLCNQSKLQVMSKVFKNYLLVVMQGEIPHTGEVTSHRQVSLRVTTHWCHIQFALKSLLLPYSTS